MSQIRSPWHDMFPKYHYNAIKRIQKIRSRRDKKYPVPDVEDEDNGLWQVIRISNTEFIYKGEIKLQDILYRLQYLAHFNESETERNQECTITMNILGADTKFRLVESKLSPNNQRGWQILVYYGDDSYPKKYENIMDSLNTVDSGKLAKAILSALETSLDTQEMFELEGYPPSHVNNVRMFILLTHIAEAAVPSVQVLKQYLGLVKSHDGNTEIKPKHGRTPMMDKIVRAKLRKIANAPTFSSEFSKDAFPSQEKGGTEMSRQNVLKGNETDFLSDIADEAVPLGNIEDETDPSSSIQDVTDPLSDIEDDAGPSNDDDDLANSFGKMNVIASDNN